MKTKILIIFIILSSLISGFIGAFLLIEFNENKNTKKINQEDSFKEITKIVTNEKITNIVDLENEITSLVKGVSPSIVSIIIKEDLVIYRSDPWGFFNTPSHISQKKVGGGTGFFVTKDGKIITNKHVISNKEAEYTIITNDNKEYDAEILAFSKTDDIAILKIKSKKELDFAPLVFIKDKKDIKIGQFAIAIGNALAEFQNSVSFGIVSGKDRTIRDGDNILSELIQTDTAINPGNSGGPLINLAGEVMGINTAILDGSNGIGFSINLTQNKVDYITNSIEKFGEIKETYIGINYIPISNGIKDEFELNSNYGLYIIDEQGAIVSGSPADNVGIRPGDIILEADNKKLTKGNDLNTLVQNKIPGETIKLKILKNDDTTLDIELILGEK